MIESMSHGFIHKRHIKGIVVTRSCLKHNMDLHHNYEDAKISYTCIPNSRLRAVPVVTSTSPILPWLLVSWAGPPT